MSDIKIKFSVHQNPLKDEQGRTTYQVRQDTHGTVTTKMLEEELALHGLQNNFTLDGAVEWLKKVMVSHMNFNRRIHLNGIGTFSLSVGLKPVVDEDGTVHKRIVTDPKDITGNEVEVTGINFVPDKEFLDYAKQELVYFENSAPRGSVGHSEWHEDEKLRQEVIGYLTEHKYLTCPLFMKLWHVTRYRAEQILLQFCEGEDAILVRQQQAHTYFYYLK